MQGFQCAENGRELMQGWKLKISKILLDVKILVWVFIYIHALCLHIWYSKDG